VKKKVAKGVEDTRGLTTVAEKRSPHSKIQNDVEQEVKSGGSKNEKEMGTKHKRLQRN